MPIDVPTAATIALEAGLGLPDVRALAILADSETEARDLATRFAPKPAAPRHQVRALVDEWIGGTAPISTPRERSAEPDRRSPNS